MLHLSRYPLQRRWFIPDFLVWGDTGLGQLDYLVTEKVAGVTSIFFNSLTIAGGEQKVLFSQLVDHRGNSLPATIKSPRVFVRARQTESPFIVRAEYPDSFLIARPSASTSSVLCDLLVLELGE